jgi:phospholipase C
MPNEPLVPRPIEHVVVLMLENRSFDNVLGGLYAAGNAPPYQEAPVGQTGFRGVPPGASNPDLAGAPVYAHNQTTPTSVGGTGPSYSPTTIPLVDPGEYFKDMAQQLIGLDAVPTSPPWRGYSPRDPNAAQGYVKNYAKLDGIGQTTPPPGNQRDVMNYFTPAQLPVSAFLAYSYGLSDEWFAPVPSQTYVNRAFALSAAPAVSGHLVPFSLIDDAQYYDPLEPIREMPTILSQLDEAFSGGGAEGPFWKVYFHDYSIAFDTVKYVQATVAAGKGLNVGTFDGSDWGARTPKQLGHHAVATSFVDDLENRRLPKFSWIEPRYFDDYAPTRLPPNSNHPGNATKPPLNPGTRAPIDAATGEVLLMELYNLLRASPLWDRTLLIVTYDENCGIWDHVPPRRATPPGHGIPAASCDSDPAARGFDYDVFGGRVPAIVVSPRVPAGSLFRAPAGSAPFDHTSIITTVRDALGLAAPPLTDRDAAAPSLLPGLDALPPNDTGPFAGTIVAGPSSLYFHHTKGDPFHPAPQTIFAGAGPGFPLAVSTSESWLSVDATGTTSMTITVKVDPAGLAEGWHSGQVTISGTGAEVPTNSGLAVPVQLQVTSLF